MAENNPHQQSIAGMHTRLDPQAIYGELEAAADKYANADRAANLAEHHADTVYEMLFKGLDSGSVDRRKAEARTTERYQTAKVRAINLRADALRAKLGWQALITKLDFLRTLESSLREQAKRLSNSPG